MLRGTGPARCDPGHQGAKFGLKVPQRQVFDLNPAFRNNNNVDREGEFLLGKSKHLPYQTLDSVPAHGIAYFFADRQPQAPRAPGIPCADKQNEVL